MSQQQKLEKVLDLLLSEDQDQAAELLHQIIVEKARTIYEGIVDEEEVDVADEKDELDEADEVGGEPSADFTDEISSDKDEVDADEQNDGEAGFDDEDDEESDDEESDEGDGSTEDRIEDLESQLAELRAEFDALMDEEMMEPNHADLDAEMGDDMEADFGAEVEPAGDAGMPDFGGPEEKVVGEVVAVMHEKKKASKLDKAPQAKDAKKDKKVDEETKFLNKVADTGQKGTAKLVGTGKGMTLGAEQNKSPYTSIPARKDYGGKPTKIGGDGGTGGEYGKYHGDSAKDETITDNVGLEPKKNGVKADTTPKYTGGKAAGTGFNQSPLTKKPA